MAERRRRIGFAVLIAALLAACHDEALEQREREDRRRMALYRAALRERRGGAYPFIFDRNGRPIASYEIAPHNVVATNKDFEPLVETLERNRISPNQRLETTLDSAVQSSAVAAIGELRASFVAIDPRTNEILAIATTGPDPLAKQYEPGSVIKVLTLLAALEGGVDVQSMFPYECKGALPISGRSFGDWFKGGHGTLSDLDEALAQSCNVAFADIGLHAGRASLEKFHQRAGFGGQTNLGVFYVPLGKKVGDLFNDFETAFYSIGLEHETATTFHLAMLASMLANRGALTTPRIYRARRSVLGVVAPPPKQTTDQIARREAVERVIAAMQAVVTRDRGTGRRARIEGLTLAMKTGTAGTREAGYDALAIGFVPVEQPKIAFALIAENAGTAEIAAARVVKGFIERLKASSHL